MNVGNGNVDELDMAAMLRDLGGHGWRPVLYCDGLGRDAQAWVCYPMGDVRAWASFHAPDPIGAVRQLYRWALAHPNDPMPRFAPKATDSTEPANLTAQVEAPTRSACVLDPSVVLPVTSPWRWGLWW